VRRVPFSRFALLDSFSAVPRASLLVFKFSAPGLVFGGTEGVGSCFRVLRSRTHFRRFRGRQVPFSRFAFPDSFSAVPGASGPVFLFCAAGLVFGGTEGVVGSCFYVLRSRTHFGLYRGRLLPFSCFARRDSFSAVPMALVLVFLFCALGIVFGGTDDVGSRFHVLHSRTHFRLYRGRLLPFSCFALPESFSTVPRASVPVFTFCVPGLVFGGIGVVGCRFLVLRARTRFRRFRGHRVPFSCFARPDSFSVVPRASGPVFLFCAPDSFSEVPRSSGPVFMFCAPGLIFGGTVSVRSRFLVLRARTRFRRYRGRRVPFSCFALAY
jgi:hypothetical protein